MKNINILILGGMLALLMFLGSGCMFGKKYKKVSVPVYQFGEQVEGQGSEWTTEKRVLVEGVREYRVQKGDTLSNISRMFNVSVSELAEYNHITNMDKIRVGMYLQIPPPSMQQKEETTYSQDENRITHTVESGETLWGIAQLYGVKVEILIDVNNLSDTTLSTGQVIYIPLK